MKEKFNINTLFLVTGGAGFIGSNITGKLLNMGYRVRVIDNFITGKKENIEAFLNNPRFEFINGDIRDLNTCITICENVDYIFHEAALGSVPRSIKDPILSTQINVIGTLNMLYAAKENNVKRFIYASSSSVYGDSSLLPKKEGEEGEVISPYAATKKADEIYAKLFYKLYKLPTIGLRYFNVYGPKQDPNSIYSAVIPLFINKVIRDEAVIINGDGSTSRDFTYVEDVIQANIKACLCDEKYFGNVYNIAYGGRITLDGLYKIIVKKLNKNSIPIHGPNRVGDIKHSNASIYRAKKELGYHPRYNIKKGIYKTIKWYQKQRE